jgi:hypothetical protein
MIYDLPEKNKSGNIFIGPYCGCFYSPGTNKTPFMSIAFKGTNFADIGEGIVDFVYETFKAPADKLFGTDVSVGVYDSLFSQFEIGTTTASPFELIQQSLLAVTASMQPGGDKMQDPVVPILHVTVRTRSLHSESQLICSLGPLTRRLVCLLLLRTAPRSPTRPNTRQRPTRRYIHLWLSSCGPQ